MKWLITVSLKIKEFVVNRQVQKLLIVLLGLCIDFKSKTITVRGVNEKLTKTEFELLSLFVSYPGEVLSREFIQQQIWRDSQLYQTSRAVDVHVQRLRKKIEAEVDKPEYIITVAGVGYKFQAN